MGVNWAAGLIRWKPHTSSDGRVYSLAHLHPFKFMCELAGTDKCVPRTVTVNVGFSLHTFTCDFARAGSQSEEYRDDRERRAFDYARYSASLQLVELIRGLENRKCFFAGNNNFFTVKMTGAPAGYEYRVFFNVRRDPADPNSVTLIVQSAYFGRMDTVPKSIRRKQVRFQVILSKALLGQPLREPP